MRIKIGLKIHGLMLLMIPAFLTGMLLPISEGNAQAQTRIPVPAQVAHSRNFRRLGRSGSPRCPSLSSNSFIARSMGLFMQDRARARFIPLAVCASADNFRFRARVTDGSHVAVFAKPDTYTYFCSIHPHMFGTIIVGDRRTSRHRRIAAHPSARLPMSAYVGRRTPTSTVVA